MDYLLSTFGYYTYEQESKCIKIQSIIKSYLAKKRVEKIKSSIILQSCIRSKLSREHIKRTNAANVIIKYYLEYYFRTKWYPNRIKLYKKINII